MPQRQLKQKETRHLKSAAVCAYNGNKSTVSQQEITEYLPLVHAVARKVTSFLKPPLTFEDLISAGTIGLVKAARDYDPSQRAKFKTYAYIKIRSAILDELKGWSFVSAEANKKINQAERTYREISHSTGKAPSDERMAAELGTSLRELYRTYEKARARNFVSMDAESDETPGLGNILAAAGNTPEAQIQKSELIEKLTQAITELPLRQRRLIVLYYQQELNMKQIAKVLEITESRVSQLHASAIFNLSQKLKEYKND